MGGGGPSDALTYLMLRELPQRLPLVDGGVSHVAIASHQTDQRGHLGRIVLSTQLLGHTLCISTKRLVVLGATEIIIAGGNV